MARVVRGVIFVTGVAGLVLLAGACGEDITDTKARALADAKLHEYAQAEGLDASMFGEPEVSSRPEHRWIFDYESEGAPSHLVRVYVGETGGVELHRMIE